MSTNKFTRHAARAGVVAVAAGMAALLGSGTASAHVTAKVIGEPAEQGGYTKITFRVPNEDDAAGTVKLEIQLPTDTPVTSLRTKPMAGWTAQVTKTTLDEPITAHGAEITEAVSSVVWTAAPGVRINPGEFGEFEVSGGPLPETDQLVIPAIQTYDNNEVVSWNEPPPAEGAEEPARPAPVVALSPAGEEPAVTPAANESGDATEAAPVDATDDTARWLGGAGLLVGALGVGFGVGATMRARRATATARQDDGA